MQLASELIFLIAGSFVGTVIVWLIAAIQMKAVRSELTAGSQIEITELRERLRSHELSLSGSQSRGQQLEMRKNELEQEVRKLSEQRAAAETTIQKERQAADEKLSPLNEAQAKLSDAFKALSSDALRSNNQSFLELAKSTLDDFRMQPRATWRAVNKLLNLW
jgi:DNA recombination protein RmuC